MIVTIPVPQSGAHFTFSAELEGISYSFELRWNARDYAWMLTMGDGEGGAIVSGIKVVINVPLLSFFGDPRLPPGVLMALDSAGTDAEAGFEDLGRRVVLIYAPLADLT